MSRAYLMFILSIAFFAGVCLLAFRVVTQNADWVQQPYNGHMASSNGLAQAGSITDRDGELLAYTDDSGERIYHSDLTTREALLHVVGDNSLNISTAVQSNFRTELTGYTFLLGLGMPNSLRTNSNVELTVDADASRAAFEALGGRKGACVVYNYKTGEVLCSTSSPTYDPQYPPEITEENEAEYDGVYLDNVMSSSFTPGSIFKIITAASAIENIPDIYEQTFECYSEYEIEGSKITCEHAHGTQDFNGAFTNSCNCAFAQIALQLGGDKLTKTAGELGFNMQFDVSGIPMAKSYYNVEKAGQNQLAWSGIGQYEDLVNPMHMAMLCGSIANSGKAKQPQIVADKADILKKFGIDTGLHDTNMLSAGTSAQVADLMRNAANSYYNSSGVSLGGLNFCAKTGTAEVGEDKEPNAWFAGYTEDEAHPYAFAAVVVEGGYGIGAAANVVSAAINSLVYQ